MTPPVDTTIPAGTIANILDAIIAEAHPRLAKGNIAHRYSITLQHLDTLLNRYGYPDKQLMRGHRDRLRRESDGSVDPGAAQSQTDAELGATESAPEGRAPSNTAGDSMQNVALTRVRPDPNNIRENLTGIEDLATSIQEVGLLQPIVVRTVGQHLVVVAGHRRLAALRHLRWTHADVVIKASLRPADVLAAMFIENNQRTDLDPIEEARALARLRSDRNLATDHALAQLVGRTDSFVAGRLALLSLTPEQQDEVRAGNMKLTEAEYKGRLNSGKVGKSGVERGWHLGPAHHLANQAKARCTRMQHPRTRTVGGMACGDCWEHVIRANERVALVEHSHQRGACPTCGGRVTAAEH